MKAIGAILIILALVIGIVPRFTDCASQGKAIELPNGKTIPMKCHWTGTAEIAVALPLLAVGVLMIVSKRKQTLRALAIVALALGLAAILLPAYLIGVCTNPEMICAMLMRPTLLFAGALTLVAGAVALVYLRGPDEEAARPAGTGAA
jgi:energy-converting hydrogenase Eha subunit A